jgi:hypothetical protein
MEDNPERGGRGGNRRVGAAKRQAKYVVRSLIIGAAARAGRDKWGRRSKGPFARSECSVLRRKAIDLSTGATSTCSAEPFQRATQEEIRRRQ